jgi:heptosyltransferase-2
MKILINALSGIGDALMFSPALRILSEKSPGSEIDMLVMYESVKELYENSPFIKSIYFIDFLRQSKYKSVKEILKIKKNKYDVSINVYPSNRFEYNFLNFLLGAKKKIGNNFVHSNFFRCEFFNNVRYNEIPDEHNVLQNIRLINGLVEFNENEIHGLEIFLKEDDEKKAIEWFKQNGLTNSIIIGIHAGSSTFKNHIHKRWDKHNYIDLLQTLIKKYDAAVLLFGTETELNDEIKKSLTGNVILASTQNYLDSLARLKYCNLFISNDTAFLHSASAFKIPIVAIFGYTNSRELYPWQNEHIIIRKDLDCSPCFYNSPKPASCKWKGSEQFKCMTQITVEEVLMACEKLIQKIPHNRKS